jgi:CubicO group peptidase (beta-lactamase class C family)
MADLEHNAPLTTQSPIEIGSVSKQFTAACILLLEQQGKLSLDDDIRKFIPEMPYYCTKITLRSMIHHLSGLKDWEAIITLAGEPVGTRVYNNDDVLDILCRQRSLNNKPGDEYLYSNSNYNLLAIVVKRASGMDLAEYSRKYIFEPAGMTHTRWRTDFREVVPGRAIAYGYTNDNQYVTDMPLEDAYGNGGLLTTAEDLTAWNNYYWAGKLSGRALLAKQLEPGRLNSGDTTTFAAGFERDSYKGWVKIGMGGRTEGYGCGLIYLPELHLSIASITNTSRNMGNQIDEVMDLLVGEKPGSASKAGPAAKQAGVSVPPAILNGYAGWYKNSRTGDALQLYLKDGKLAVSNAGFRAAPEGPLTGINERTFTMQYWGKILIQPNHRLLFIHPVRDTVVYTGVDAASSDLQKYAGDYYSDEAGVKFSIRVKGKNLVLKENPQDTTALTATYKDGFYYWRGSLYFERDKSKKITSFKLSLPRARNLTFKKTSL